MSTFHENVSPFYTKLSKLCLEKGVSITQFSKEVGLSNATASKWKNGSKPFHSSLYRIAKYFDVDMDYLLNDKYTNYDKWLSEVKGVKTTPIVNADRKTNEKVPTKTIDVLDDEFLLLAKRLTPDQVQRVKDFMRGMLS